MKTIIAGSRTVPSYEMAADAIEASGFSEQITEVVCGEARGADTMGATWADLSGIPVKRFPADWKANGKAAGPIRNRQMADYADALIAVWDGASRGTRNMIEEATKRGLRVFVHRIG